MKNHFKICLPALLLCLFALQVNAHEIWLERDGQGPVRVYFGHYDGESVQKTGGRLDSIKADVVVPAGSVSRTNRREDHIELAVSTSGDIALIEGMNPRKSRNSEDIMRVVFLARHGNSEAIQLLPFDLVPSSPGSNNFTLMYLDKPLSGAEIKLYDPDRHVHSLISDDKGQVTIDMKKPGRYVAMTSHMTEEAGIINDLPYHKTRYALTLAFEKNR